MKIEALTDSYSIFSYLAAAHLKLPAEKSTYYHLAYLREKLVSRHIRSYNWTDTRDMVADGLTKGTADRSPLAAIMDGTYNLHYNVHEYREPTATGSSAPHASVSEPTYAWTIASLDDDPCVTVGGGAYGTSTTHVGSNVVASRLNLTEPKEGGSDLITSWFIGSPPIVFTHWTAMGCFAYQ